MAHARSGDSERHDAPPDAVLEAAFADGPEAERSVRRAREVVAAVHEHDAAGLARADGAHRDALLELLVAACAVAPFLAPWLLRHPEWLLELAADDLATPRSLQALEASLHAALRGVPEGDTASVLRRFKYRELLRVVARDASPRLVPETRVGETLAELSHLAEALLRRALAAEQARLDDEVGAAEWPGAGGARHRLRFAVLGLGKLGGEELNFSSDVDVVYVYESPPEGAGALGPGPGGLAPPEYFARLARRFGRAVEATTAEGFLYRVDPDLRPEGAGSALVVSSSFLADYFDGWAAAWEKAAFMKARPVAGALEFGWRVVRSLDPMIYQSSVDLAGVRSIREMKEKVEAQHEGAEDDVKLGPGGIRDLEFVAQALQLLHGGRAPQVRGRSAPGALRALAGVGALEQDHAEALVRAWAFLRRVENRIQMESERQTHRLPAAGAPRERLARALGFGGADPAEAFAERLARERATVRARFDALLGATRADRILDAFARGASSLMAVSQTRAMLEELARRFDRAIEASADPERALIGLERFVQGVGGRRFYYGLLLDRPELVSRLAALFGASRYLAGVLATHPELIEPVFADPEHLLASREELEAEVDEVAASLRETGRDEEEVQLAALRLFQHRELVNVALLDLSEKIDARQVEAALSDVAEVCIGRALALARERLAGQRRRDGEWAERGDFLVVGMGKLGSRELGYGSDLDVIFLYDVPDEAQRDEAQESFVRLAQKLAWVLHTRTAEGVCYEVDARLRPSGNQGMLVTSLDGFARYHEGSAQAWERQSLLRARPVAGSERLAERFRRLRDAILRRPLPEDLAAEIHRIRRRMETELAQERPGRRDLKTGRGGLVDVEMVVQLLQLRHGPEHPELLEPVCVGALLERIEAAGLLAATQVGTLREGWRFLQRLSSRLRIVENRSITDWSEDRADLDAVARALGYPESARTGTARLPLLEDYRRRTEAVRAVYREVFAAEGAPVAEA